MSVLFGPTAPLHLNRALLADGRYRVAVVLAATSAERIAASEVHALARFAFEAPPGVRHEFSHAASFPPPSTC